MDERSVRQLLLARYYLHLAAEQLRSEADASKFAAINLLHEGLETTLISCADHLNAHVAERSGIEVYLDRINAKLIGSELPFRSRILRFNKARVAAKHHLTLPEQSFLTLMGTVVPEFIEAAVRLSFQIDLFDVSLADLVEEAVVAQHIRDAQGFLASDEHYKCLIAARKAFYIQFEKQYDIRDFLDEDKAKHRGLLSLFSICKAPFHTKNPDYIRQNVSRPSDYIVIDHASLDTELMKDGVDVQTFWNIWRLTPKVYQYEDGSWSSEYDFDLADDAGIKDSCVYVLDNLISITLQRQARRKRSKTRNGAYRYIQTVPNARILKKADNTSDEVGRLPEGVRRVNLNQVVPALDREGFYYQVSYLRKNGPFLFGYIHPDDTEGEPLFGFVADGVDLTGAISGSLEEGASVEGDPEGERSP